VQRERLRDAARKAAGKSHRERVEELNAKLEKLPEHNELFNVQMAGTG
jgi:hypothetical protein